MLATDHAKGTAEMLLEGATRGSPSRSWKRRGLWRTVTAILLALAGCKLALPARRSLDATAALRAAMYVAEDRRGAGGQGLRPLLDGLRHPDAAIRAQAVRALGRLEDPVHVQRILPLLGDSAVRDEAAFAVAQALQGRRRASAPLVDSVLLALQRSAVGAPSAVVLRSVGRLPYPDSLAAAAAVRWLVEVAHGVADSVGSMQEHILGIIHGLYTLARRHRGAVAADEGAVELLRQVAGRVNQVRGAPSRSLAQRLAWHTLSALQIRGLDREAIDAWESSDWQLRRSILLYLPLARDSQSVQLLLDRARRDTAFQVRYEWVRAFRRLLAQRAGCEPILGALGDPNPHVQLAAVDALDASCGGNEALARLRALAQEIPAAGDRAPGRASWHLGARALVALARIEPDVSIPIVRRATRHPIWQVRMYAARAAEQARDTMTLSELARDRVGSVREAAISGLARVAGHAADSIFVEALASPDYHVVLAGASGLRGSPRGSSYLEAALKALARLTGEAKETSRDPRLALLERIGEWGGRHGATRLRPYLDDFDPEIAARAAAILREWAPEQDAVLATPRLRPHVESAIASVALAGPVRLEVVMAPESGGGAFVLCLCRPAVTPATAARILRLVRSGYYDGLTWHRVVTNFVIQGGSPGMNEYAGDGPFMRDEISEQMHLRGTVGISTRGRDTGDAQWFVNLVDNYRLDYEYTVFATVESGMDVVDGILEGDRILQVRVLPSGGDRIGGLR